MNIISQTEWTESTTDPGHLTKTIKFEGNITVEVLRPILNNEERKKREELVKRLAEAALSAYYRRKDLEAYEKQHSN